MSNKIMQHPVVGFSFILITCLQENVLLIIPGTVRRSRSSGKQKKLDRNLGKAKTLGITG